MWFDGQWRPWPDAAILTLGRASSRVARRHTDGADADIRDTGAMNSMPNPFSYEGKRAAVVGGASGIGAATAELLGQLGADVIVLDIQAASAPGVTEIGLDLTDRESIDRAVGECGGPVDALLSCAGVADGPLLPKINFIGQRHFIERVVEAGWMPRGSALAMVSSAGGRGWEMNLPTLLELIATPTYEDAVAWMEEHPDMTGYAQSKQAVCAYVARKALDFGRLGIRINALMPGPTDTPLAQANADIWLKYASDYRSELGLGPSTAEEQASILAFLCSPAAARIYGESIVSDAGAGVARLTGTFEPSFN
jgi:NAD(P)-dependent dehydrogenase (short-subunit alcohol dehydrogenase family)